MQPENSTAIIMDRHELHRAGLAVVLRRDIGFASVVEAASMDEVFERLGSTPGVGLATFDLVIPDTKDIRELRLMRERFPAVRLAVIATSVRSEDILLALSAGVHGYVPRSLKIEEIVRALRLVLEGYVFVPSSLTEPLVRNDHAAAAAQVQRLDGLNFTPRQRQVLRCLAEGKSNKAIARSLDLAEGTIKVHVNALFRTLGVHNRISAIRAISQLGLDQKD